MPRTNLTLSPRLLGTLKRFPAEVLRQIQPYPLFLTIFREFIGIPVDNMAHRFTRILPRSRTLPLGQKLGLSCHPAMTKDRINVPLIRRYSLLDVARLEVEQLHRFPLDKRLDPVLVNRVEHPGCNSTS
jgi:hypothetical protein